MFSNALALKLAARQSPVFIFSLELPSRTVLRRMMYALTKVDNWAYRSYTPGSSERNEAEGRLMDALNSIDQLSLWIDDRRGLRPLDIRATLLAHCKAWSTPSLVIVDYLNLVKPEQDRRSTYESISETIRHLKDIGGELGVPMLVLAQLNRQPEVRVESAKRPTMADLRDSGAIEEVASVMIALFRQTYYFKTGDEWLKSFPNEPYPKNEMEVIILKQQDGPTGTIKLYCDLSSGFMADLVTG